MNELKIYYPFRPFIQTQRWGNPNPMYKEAGFGFNLHNGIDANTGKIDWEGKIISEYPVFCPVEDFTVHRVDYAPNGGGNEMWLVSNKPLQMFERKAYAYIPLCHAKKILVGEGYQPKLGELIMIADNTGFSTGIHTHIGLYRIEYDGKNVTKWVDNNDANGSFDPSLFFTGEFAVDKADVTTLVRSGMRYLAYRMAG